MNRGLIELAAKTAMLAAAMLVAHRISENGKKARRKRAVEFAEKQKQAGVDIEFEAI